ncbi:MAG: DUF1285 domain-containing protein [Desulfobacteraceae bacterium]|nr:MAG: DUF1285 domain-containing protein [Desulfobacteraceae bacterium]
MDGDTPMADEKETTTGIGSDIRPCEIFIDKEGQWFYKGAEMHRREIVRFFYEHLSLDGGGRYILEWAGERCLLEAEDTAFVVKRVAFDGGFFLSLSDDSVEKLAPDTLYVGDGNVLYCLVHGAFPARFTRPAYYQLAAYIEEEDGAFVLPVGANRYPIKMR